MRVLVLDGHPDHGRLTQALIAAYVGGLPPGTEAEVIAVRDLQFDPILARGYAAVQPWEPDLRRLAAAIVAADHLVVVFPLWWGAEPAPLKGLLDRLLLPGFGFRYRRDSPMWDKLLAGRSADVIVSMDTPPWFLRWVWGDPVGRRWRHQILGFAGFAPVRVARLGMVRRGGVARSMPRWTQRLAEMARGVAQLRRRPRNDPPASDAAFAAAIADRRS